MRQHKINTRNLTPFFKKYAFFHVSNKTRKSKDNTLNIRKFNTLTSWVLDIVFSPLCSFEPNIELVADDGSQV